MLIWNIARLKEFSNLRLGIYTPYAHENSNQSLNVDNFFNACTTLVGHIDLLLSECVYQDLVLYITPQVKLYNRAIYN